jgi:membrane associated rhomboid family serine protease
MLLPIRAKNPPETFPWVTVVLLSINILVFVVVNRGLPIPDEVVDVYGLIPSQLSPLTFLTSAFLHSDIFHLLGNMWFLYLFGFAVEGRMGWWKYILLYFASGLCGDLLHLLLFGAAQPDLPSIGASGAIMGLIGAAVYMFPHAKIVFFYWLAFFWVGTFEVAMYLVGIFYLAGDVFGALLWGSSAGVGHLAHIGGGVGGLVLALAMRMRRDSEETSEAKAVLADAKDYSILSSRELEDLAEAQPDNTEITLHWAIVALKSSSTISPTLVERLHSQQQKLLTTEDEGSVARIFASFADMARIRPLFLLEAGRKAEQMGDPNTATQLYQKAFQSPLANEDDQQAAAFRNAMLMEAWHQNYVGAEDLYRWMLDRWPMCSLESQIRTRLAVVTPRAAAQRAQANPLA